MAMKLIRFFLANFSRHILKITKAERYFQGYYKKTRYQHSLTIFLNHAIESSCQVFFFGGGGGGGQI